MAIYRGEENIKALYRGGSPIARAYVGGTLVYQRPTSATMKKTLFQNLVPTTATEIYFLRETGTDLTGYSKIGVVDDDGWIEVWKNGTKYKVVSDSTIMPDTCSNLFDSYSHVTAFNFTNFDTSNVTNMSYMFRANSLITLNISTFDTANVSNMTWMFSGCISLKKIISNTFDKTSLSNSAGMFNACSALVGGNGTIYNSTKIDATYARVDTAETPGYFTAPTE